jgi:hypothetical protein
MRPAIRPIAAKPAPVGGMATPVPHKESAEGPKSVHRLRAPSGSQGNHFSAEEVPTRPTGARPAAIEVVTHDEAVSDRLSEEMYRAIESVRSCTRLVVAPSSDAAPVPELSAARAVASPSETAADPSSTALEADDELLWELDAIDALTHERTRALAAIVHLVLLTSVLTTLVWYVSR